jgi:hypothetical protein
MKDSAYDLVRSMGRGLPGRAVDPHPGVATVDAQNRVWARATGLVADDLAAARHAAIRCGSFAAHTYALAPFAVVALGADLITWLYLFDDRYGEGLDGEGREAMQQRFATFESTVRTGRLPEAPTVFHTALLDLRDRALVLARDAAADLGADEADVDDWLRRFADSFATYFRGCLAELPHRRDAKAKLDLDGYRVVRRDSVGAFPVFDLIELGSGLLPPEVARSPEIERARALGALLCAWVNDVYSFPKEQLDGDPLNLVTVIASSYALDVTDALGAAAQVFHTDLAFFESACDDARTAHVHARGERAAHRSVVVSSYLDGLAQWVHGNTAWTGLSGRYALPAETSEPLRRAGGVDG